MIKYLVTMGALAALLFHAGAAGAGELLVVSKPEAKLLWYDADSGELLGSADTGRGPGELAVTPNGRIAFVSDFGSRENTVSVYDVPSKSLTGKIRLEKALGPHGLDITRNGKLLYVTGERKGTIAVVDVATQETVMNMRTSMKGAHMLTLTPDDKHVIFANRYAGNVSVFDTKTGGLVRHILTGRRPEGMDVSPDGKELWVADLADNGISVIDLQAGKRIETIPCVGTPVRLRFAPDGKRVFVTCTVIDQLRVFDAATREVVTNLTTAKSPHALDFDVAGNRLFVGNGRGNTVSVVSMETLEITNEFPVMKTPVALAYVK